MESQRLFRFHIFGLPRLIVGEEPVSLPPQPAAFCAFLALNRQRRITREEVQAAFWPDAPPARAQERLRRTLYLLRQAIHPHSDLVASEGSEIALAPDVQVWIDYEAFEQALMEAYRSDPPRRQPLEAAVALYQDDLLKDIYAEWALTEREHAHQRLVAALRHLCVICQHDQAWNDVIRYAYRLLDSDPLQEVAHRALMTAYAASGDRSAAIRQYQQCAQILQEELDVEPMEETTRLVEDIRQGRGLRPDEAPPAAIPVPAILDMHAGPLVGRDRELAAIAAEWRICQIQNSRLVLITGAAGMGKSRLAEEAALRIPGPHVTVIVGHCYAMEAGTPYQLISELVRQAVDRVGDHLSPDMRSDLAALVPALRPDARLDTATLPGLATDTSIRRQEAVTDVFRLLASSGDGVWVVAEDLHWADPASLACLNHMLRRCATLPLMVIATLRDEEVPFDSPLMDWPVSSVHAPAPTTLIQLLPLAQDQLHEWVAHLGGHQVTGLVPLLFHETAGSPFFVVETLHALVEQGVLHSDHTGRWQVRLDALPPPTDLPVSGVVLRVIQRRIRRLSRAAQEVLTIAAVIEHDIDERLLAALIDPSLALDLALDEVLRASILKETSPGLYQFSHIKVREIIYADTSAPRRRLLHRRVAELLPHSAGSEGLPGISRLAYHYAQAREWTQALSHGWQAAHIAFATGAMAEANRYAEIAQDILDQHAAALDARLLPESLPAIRFDVLALRAEFHRQAATAGLYYPPDMIEAIQALLGDVDESRRGRAALQQAVHRLGQGDLDGALRAVTWGRALFAQLNDRLGELDAVQRHIEIAYRAGDLVMMRRLLGDLRDLSAPFDHATFRQSVAANEMRLAVYEADWTRVLNLAEQLSNWQQVHFDPSVAWLALANLGLAYMKLGAYERAYSAAQQAVEACASANVLGLGARVLLARLELWRGNVEHAHEVLATLLEHPDPLMGEVEVVAPALALVRCCVAAGDVDGAKQWAERAALAVSRVRLPTLFPLSQVAGAFADIAAGDYDHARKRLLYPVEYLLLLEDTSPQEILALRAAAARGLGRETEAVQWLEIAWDTIQKQAATISDPAYQETFVSRVPLHQFIARALKAAKWHPAEVLDQQNLAGEWAI